MIRTPLQKIQNEAAESLFADLRPGPTRDRLDAFVVQAFDAGIAAAKEAAAETATYVVSTQPDRIESAEDDSDFVTPYLTPEDAGQAIVNGFHGEAGTRYVLRVVTAVEVVYDRAWTLIRKDA